ncbi:MAG TPA: hypothetical protein PLK99_03210 [Burkholderiales bacterium]|nr:hypothetical protein [Burkholderiales bacterium]
MAALKRTSLAAFATLPLLFCPGKAAVADGLANQIPSCYKANQIQPLGPLYDKLFVVMIDQTVMLDAPLQKQVLQSIETMIQPGTRYVIGEFSAFSQGHYLNIVASGIAEAPIPASQIGNIPIDEVDPFNKCMSDQLNFARLSAEKSAYIAMQAATSSLDQSDILLAMKDISTPIRDETAVKKVMLAVTDGLENSTVTSFYGHGTARNINPAAEMRKVESANMTGDFGGAKIYVLGGAAEPPATSGTKAARDGYRDPQMLMHLQDFWNSYFRASDASLVEFGTPALVMRIEY